MSPGRPGGLAVIILALALGATAVVSTPAQARHGEYIQRFAAEATLLRGVAGPAPAELRFRLLEALQKRLLDDRTELTSWDAADKKKLFAHYEKAWDALTTGDGRSDAVPETTVDQHDSILEMLGQRSGDDVLATMIAGMKSDDEISKALARGVKQLEKIPYRTDAANPKGTGIHARCVAWIEKWPADRRPALLTRDLDHLGRFAKCVPPPEQKLVDALLAFATRFAEACNADGKDATAALPHLNTVLDAIRTSELTPPDALATHLQRMLAAVPRRVDETGLRMDFAGAEAEAIRGRKDVTAVNSATLVEVQVYDNDAWVEPGTAVITQPGDTGVFYLVPKRTFRLRYRLELAAAAEGTPTWVWLKHKGGAHAGPAQEPLLPRYAVRDCTYHAAGKQGFWLSSRLWRPADALERMAAFHRTLPGDSKREAARSSFIAFWKASNAAVKNVDHRSLQQLFKETAGSKFNEHPLLFKLPVSRSAISGLAELANGARNLVNAGGHDGEALAPRRFAQDLLKSGRPRGKDGVIGLIGESGRVFPGPRRTTAPERFVGIRTVIAMEETDQKGAPR